MRRLTRKRKIAMCYAEAGELRFQARGHRALALNGLEEERSAHLQMALYKEAQARDYMKLAIELSEENK